MGNGMEGVVLDIALFHSDSSKRVSVQRRLPARRTMTPRLGNPVRCEARTQAHAERRWDRQNGIEMRTGN
jgi:hypothetical protein